MRRHLSVLRSRFWLIIFAVVLATGAAFAASLVLAKTYQSQATLIVGQSLTAVSPDLNQLLVSQRLSRTYADLATTYSVLQAVADSLGLDTPPPDLAKQVSAEAPTESTLLRIQVSDKDPETAAAIANGVAEQLIKVSPAVQGQRPEVVKAIEEDLTNTQARLDEVEAQLTTLRATKPTEALTEAEITAQINALEAQAAALRNTYVQLLALASNSSGNLLSIFEVARPATDPSSIGTGIAVVLGLLVGLLVGLGLAYVADHLDDRVKTAEAVRELTRLPTLASIPRVRTTSDRNPIYALVSLLYPRGEAAEGFRMLRTNLDYASVDSEVRTLLVTSAGKGDGKTTVSANLAVAFAQAGKRTLLVDADLRRPDVHQLLGVSNEDGLTTLLRDGSLRPSAVMRATSVPGLSLLTAGPIPPNPSELLGSQRMGALMEGLRSTADVIVFDSAPIGLVADAAILSRSVDGILLVVDTNHTSSSQLAAARDALDQVGAKVLGVVLNRTPGQVGAGHYAYYGSAPSDRETASGDPAASRT